jgi:Protein of unknown function (DUF1573)
MKKTVFLGITLVAALFVFQNASSINKLFNAAWAWEKSTHSFGKIEQNKPVTAVFEFTNTGDTPLIITQAQGSCGCTVPSYTKEPIAPGQTGTVKAVYNAANSGVFNKTVTVTANTEQSKVLTITGEVVAKQ